MRSSSMKQILLVNESTTVIPRIWNCVSWFRFLVLRGLKYITSPSSRKAEGAQPPLDPAAPVSLYYCVIHSVYTLNTVQCMVWNGLDQSNGLLISPVQLDFDWIGSGNYTYEGLWIGLIHTSKRMHGMKQTEAVSSIVSGTVPKFT